MIGVEIGSYRIVRQLGEGGMGAVYEAAHTKLGRRAALKMLLPHLSAHQQIVERFFNEARAATAISDPGIVQIFDFGYHSDGSAYIVMELLEGEPLDRRLAQTGRLPAVDAVRICRQVATSLARAHAKGIVHRDLKPENIYLVPDAEVPGGERAKILDFGIAKLLGDDTGSAKTRTGAFIGTPSYASPEQCRGAREVDHRSDIYTLGCILFRLLVGRSVFEGEGVGDLISAHMREPPPVPSTLVSGISPDLDAIILRCLAKDPLGRFQSMGELAVALGALSAQLGGPIVTGSTPAFGVPRVVLGVGLATPVENRSTLGGSAAQLVPPVPAVPAGSVGPATWSGGAGRGRVLWLVGGAAVLGGGVLAVVLATSSSGSAGHAAAPVADAAPRAVAASAPSPRPDAAPVEAPAVDAAPAVVAAPAVDAAPAGPPAPIALPAGATAPRPSRKNRKPDYPKRARGRATVELRLVVDLDGSVRSVELASGAPPFSDAALAVAKHWRFTPARLDGRPVAVFHDMSIPFAEPSTGKKRGAGSGSEETCPPELCTR